ncbi:MAG: VWA domain-containing protein [Bacteroidota bacterium]
MKIYSRKRIFLLTLIAELAIVLFCVVIYAIVKAVYGEVLFQRSEFFIAVLGTFVASAMILFYLLEKNKSIKKIGDSRIVAHLIPDLSQGKLFVKYFIYRFALLLLAIALINPKYGIDEVETKQEGIEIMLCLDVSNSMKAEDFKPSRIEKAKRSIRRLIDGLHGDKIGLIVFAGEAYVQTPITTDYAAANMFLSSVGPGIIPKNRQGTAIGTAIELAVESFDLSSEENKAIIVITDGENHEDDAIVAATKARDNGIVVHTIGMGSEKGAPIPLFVRGQRLGFQKDKDGETVVSKLNEKNLKEIAGAGNGVFIRATEKDTGLSFLLEEIENMEKTEYDSSIYADYQSSFYPFLFFAFLLILLESFISERKSKWLDRLKIFQA